MSERINARARELLALDRFSVARQIDHIFAILLPVQWLVSLVVALTYSPLAWEGLSSRIHPHVWGALFLGGLIVSLPTALAIFRPGETITRHCVCVGQMAIGSLLIHLTGGRIESHFHIFGSLAFLALYRDWRLLLTATYIVLIDHFLRGEYWPTSIFGTTRINSWRWIEHAGWVVFEDLVLIFGGSQVNRMAREVALRQAELEATRDAIEHTVDERTGELRRTNLVLEQQVVEREMAETARKGAESRSVSILESVVDGIITIDAQGVIESHNQAALRMFGYIDDVLNGKNLRSLFPELAEAAKSGDLASFLEVRDGKGLPVSQELKGLRKDGNLFPVEISISEFSIDDLTLFTGTIHDITERKIAEQELAAAERECREIMEAVPDMIYVLDTTGRLLKWNKRLEIVTGLSPEALNGRPAVDFFTPEFHWAIEETVRRTLETGLGEVEADLLRESGNPIPYQFVTAPLRNESGELIGLAGVGRDVSERRRAEEDLLRAHGSLEERVFERTAELQWTNESLMNEVSERSRIEEELRAGEQRLRFQADAMPQIVWTARPDGSIDYWNRQWYEFTGISEETPEDASWQKVIHPDDLPKCEGLWGRSLREGTPFQSEFRFHDRKTGDYRWHLGRAIALRDEQGAVMQWVGTCTDIDDHKRNEEALQRAHDDLDRRVQDRTRELQEAIEWMQVEVIERRRAEEEALVARETAEAATRAKSEFLANMSHEIRTPMNGVIGMTELALDTELSNRQREYLEVVRSSADALLTVINDILDFSKIEADKLDLDPVAFEVHGCLEETLHVLALRAHGKGLELVCRIGKEVPAVLIGDANRLRQIIVNLIGNAIKFTEHGEVFVGVGSEKLSDDRVSLSIAVTDTGIGIAKEKQQRIFEPFEQADGSTTRKYGGTGLGLAIASKLIELMGGKIKIESEVGKGSTFSFNVILGKASAPALLQKVSDPSKLAGLPILIVDDNATNRWILEEILINWGARPISVENGLEALEVLRRAAKEGTPFAAGLIDLMMPEMDGMTLIEKIREEPSLANLAVLILTSAGRAEDGSRARSLGISSYLNKPVRQSELLNCLVASLTPSQGLNSLDEPAPKTSAVAKPSSSTPNRKLHVLLADDHPVNQKMAGRLLEGMGHTVVIASDGREAVEHYLAETFDIVLMDVQMPVMDGFEAVSAIRVSGRPQVPIVAVTAYAMKGDRERCLDAGFDGYLAKPIRSKELLRTLESFVPNLAGETESIPEPIRVTEESPSFIVSLMDRLTVRCGNDHEFAKEIFDSFIETAPQAFEALDAARRSKNGAALAFAAHGLKGGCLTVCAEELAAGCRKIEEATQVEDFETADAAVDSVFAQWDRLKASLPATSGASL